MTENKTTRPAPKVYSEVAEVQTLALWGEPSCEVLLGQFLPQNISLYFRPYDVVEARHESGRMGDLLKSEGVEVIRIKDAFAETLKEQDFEGMPSSLADLAQQIKIRAHQYYEEYEHGDLAVLESVEAILAEETERYGEETAIKLNWWLSLSNPLPVSNIFYARDQSTVLGDRMVLTRLRWDIRKPEVAIYEAALRHLGYGDALVSTTAGHIEGGDIMIFGDACLMGVGVRSARDSVADIYRQIGSRLYDAGIEIRAVVHPTEVDLNPDKPGVEMQAMHLDTFWSPLDDKTVLCCMEEVEMRRVERVTDKDGEIVFEDMGRFDDYLSERGVEMIDVSREEQINYATNFLNLGKGRVMVPLSENKRVVELLEKRGYTVIPADIKELVGGYGAVHCMTAAINRK